MYRSEYIVCFRSEISFVPLLFSHRTPFLRPYWQIYFNSTSNHNSLMRTKCMARLFLISILHQTTTAVFGQCSCVGCFLFQFYIKPQPLTYDDEHIGRCFLFQFYIKPQLQGIRRHLLKSCFLFQFYIKPQPRICDLLIVIRLCGRMNGTNGA